MRGWGDSWGDRPRGDFVRCVPNVAPLCELRAAEPGVLGPAGALKGLVGVGVSARVVAAMVDGQRSGGGGGGGGAGGCAAGEGVGGAAGAAGTLLGPGTVELTFVAMRPARARARRGGCQHSMEQRWGGGGGVVVVCVPAQLATGDGRAVVVEGSSSDTRRQADGSRGRTRAGVEVVQRGWVGG